MQKQEINQLANYVLVATKTSITRSKAMWAERAQQLASCNSIEMIIIIISSGTPYLPAEHVQSFIF